MMVAIKIIETDKIKEDYVRKNLLREAQLMRRLKHPNIIRLYETMKANNLYCLVTEVAEGGELLTHVRSDYKEKRLSEAAARPFIRQLVSALFHLHSVGIVHRDLKMENILLDKKKRNVKIVDFGLSNAQQPGSLLQTHCGSPEYAAPELFVPGREYGPEVDVWSLGVNMYAMLVGKLPFRSPRQGSKRRQKLLEQISAGLVEHHETEMAHISHEGRDLIARLLQPDPRRRVRLADAMKHQWVTKDGSQPLQPYRQPQPDPAIQHNIIELMSLVLEVNHMEIKETVRRDRCDWLASIFNLLLDQPEGCNFLQQLVTGDPEDQLVDAATYHGSIENMQLSQKANDDMPDPPEVVQALVSATAQAAPYARMGHRHSLAGVPGIDYDASTLPVTRRERKRHHSNDAPRPLGQPRIPPPGPAHPIYQRRGSTPAPIPSPEHHLPHHRGDHHLVHTRRLPVTPNEEPYMHPRMPFGQSRPHSRADSEPCPLPVRPVPKPLKKVHHHRLSSDSDQYDDSVFVDSPPRSPLGKVSKVPMFKEPLLSPLANLIPRMGKKHGGTLSPIRRPHSVSLHQSHRLSGSIDAHLHMKSHELLPLVPDSGAVASWDQAQGVPTGHHHPHVRHTSVHASPLGWQSDAHMNAMKRVPKDIDVLMKQGIGGPGPYASMQNLNQEPQHHKLYVSSPDGSTTSIEPRQELFSSGGSDQQQSAIVAGGTSRQVTKSPECSHTVMYNTDPSSGRDHAQKIQYQVPRRSGSASASTYRDSVMEPMVTGGAGMNGPGYAAMHPNQLHSRSISQGSEHSANYSEHSGSLKGRPVSEHGKHGNTLLGSLRGPFRKASKDASLHPKPTSPTAGFS